VSELVPEAFAAIVAHREPDAVEPGSAYAVSGAEWLRQLPRLLADLLDAWGLTVDGPTGWGRLPSSCRSPHRRELRCSR